MKHTRRVHHTANDESRCRAASQMKSWTFLHAEVLDQTTLREKVRRQLDGATETRADHRRIHTTVQATSSFRGIDLAQAVERVAVLVLCADGKERRIRLEAGFHEEEWRGACCTNDTGRGTGEDINAERLDVRIVVDGRRDSLAQGLVKAKTASVEKNLVDILRRIVLAPRTDPRQLILNIQQSRFPGTTHGDLRSVE